MLPTTVSSPVVINATTTAPSTIEAQTKGPVEVDTMIRPPVVFSPIYVNQTAITSRSSIMNRSVTAFNFNQTTKAPININQQQLRKNSTIVQRVTTAIHSTTTPSTQVTKGEIDIITTAIKPVMKHDSMYRRPSIQRIEHLISSNGSNETLSNIDGPTTLTAFLTTTTPFPVTASYVQNDTQLTQNISSVSEMVDINFTTETVAVSDEPLKVTLTMNTTDNSTERSSLESSLMLVPANISQDDMMNDMPSPMNIFFRGYPNMKPIKGMISVLECDEISRKKLELYGQAALSDELTVFGRFVPATDCGEKVFCKQPSFILSLHKFFICFKQLVQDYETALCRTALHAKRMGYENIDVYTASYLYMSPAYAEEGLCKRLMAIKSNCTMGKVRTPPEVPKGILNGPMSLLFEGISLDTTCAKVFYLVYEILALQLFAKCYFLPFLQNGTVWKEPKVDRLARSLCRQAKIFLKLATTRKLNTFDKGYSMLNPGLRYFRTCHALNQRRMNCFQ